MKIESQFAVPLGRARLRPCEALNDELAALFVACEDDEHRNHSPSHIPQQELFESRFNLFHWQEDCVRRLRQFMLDSVAQTVLEVTTLSADELQRLTIHNHTWFHLTRFAGSFICHNHPLASWSAVYCVRAGEEPPNLPQSGLLRLFDPRHGAGAYQDPANARLRPGFALRPMDIRLAEGELVVFPSYLFHEVSPFYGRDLRITVATNCWFTP